MHLEKPLRGLRAGHQEHYLRKGRKAQSEKRTVVQEAFDSLDIVEFLFFGFRHRHALGSEFQTEHIRDVGYTAQNYAYPYEPAADDIVVVVVDEQRKDHAKRPAYRGSYTAPGGKLRAFDGIAGDRAAQRAVRHVQHGIANIPQEIRHHANGYFHPRRGVRYRQKYQCARNDKSYSADAHPRLELTFGTLDVRRVHNTAHNGVVDAVPHLGENDDDRPRRGRYPDVLRVKVHHKSGNKRKAQVTAEIAEGVTDLVFPTERRQTAFTRIFLNLSHGRYRSGIVIHTNSPLYRISYAHIRATHIYSTIPRPTRQYVSKNLHPEF